MEIMVRSYEDADYDALVALYRQSKDFTLDKETDARARLAEKIRRDPESIIVATSNSELLGSLSIIEDGRIAILFRWVAVGTDQNKAYKALLGQAEKILTVKGYKEVHCMVPDDSAASVALRTSMNFKPGKKYSWFWKTL
jgi:ribosomal protein S18 acetylase RimI-like enzyme